MPERSEQTEKAIDWIFKVTTALAIPALVWSFKLSTQVAVLEQKVKSQQETIERVETDLKEQISDGNKKLDKIYDNLLKRP